MSDNFCNFPKATICHYTHVTSWLAIIELLAVALFLHSLHRYFCYYLCEQPNATLWTPSRRDCLKKCAIILATQIKKALYRCMRSSCSVYYYSMCYGTWLIVGNCCKIQTSLTVEWKHLFLPVLSEFVWVEEVELLSTLSYSFKKEKPIWIHIVPYWRRQLHLCIRLMHHNLPGLCGLLRCVCRGDGSYLLSISQQRSIGRLWKATQEKKWNLKNETAKLK